MTGRVSPRNPYHRCSGGRFCHSETTRHEEGLKGGIGGEDSKDNGPGKGKGRFKGGRRAQQERAARQSRGQAKGGGRASEGKRQAGGREDSSPGQIRCGQTRSRQAGGKGGSGKADAEAGPGQEIAQGTDRTGGRPAGKALACQLSEKRSGRDRCPALKLHR